MENVLTNNERVILENIDEQYQWIARDENGDLYIYENEPHKKFCWVGFGEFVFFSAFNHLFQMVQWKDEEPTLIDDLLR